MNKNELMQFLEKENIPFNSYSLDGGLPNDRLCLDRTYQGWTVYYSEMGEKYEEMGFPSEEDACEHFYRRIKEITGLI